ncbi:MAG: hypothetical protein HXY18_15805 [Bryobacteraceae bacterium]|nr:hypothetical protein [Bryobacteraceae bacterium]
MVRVDEVRADANGVGLAAKLGYVALRHDDGALHAAGFADIELIGEVAVIRELLAMKPPGTHFRL